VEALLKSIKRLKLYVRFTNPEKQRRHRSLNISKLHDCSSVFLILNTFKLCNRALLTCHNCLMQTIDFFSDSVLVTDVLSERIIVNVFIVPKLMKILMVMLNWLMQRAIL